MRKVSTLVGLTLFALAGMARAQEEAPAAAPAGEEPAAAPAGDAAAPPVAAAEAAPAATSDSKMQVGLNLMPMLLGKAKMEVLGSEVSTDMKLAYGIGVTFGYAVIPGLYVGVAPQFLLNVKGKDQTTDASKAVDLLARIAYVYPVMPQLGVYAEVMPGYSIIMPPEGDKAKGFVIAGGVGGNYDINEQIYLNLGVGYQYGMQKVSGVKFNLSYLRVAVGAGMRF
jgi:hypothetical protein